VAECAGQGPRLRGRLTVRQLDLLLRRMDGLGSLPVVITSLLELTAPPGADATDPEQRLAEAARLITMAPGLTATVLSAAGRARGEPVRSVTQAVAALGLEEVRSIILAAGARSGVATDGPLSPAALLRHSLAVGSGAALLAQRVGLPLPDETVFTAGLLHDIGKFVLGELVPKSYARALARARRGQCPLAEAERQEVGIDHLVAGRRLAQRWKLSPLFEHVIWLHHQPAEAMPSIAADPRLIRLVGLADAIARRLRLGASGNGAAGPPPEELAEALGVSATAVAEIGGRLIETVERHARVLRLEQAESQDLCTQALTDVKVEVSHLNDRLRRRAAELSAQAEAFGQFADFAAGLTPDAEVADVLLQAARSLAGGPDEPAGEPVVSYAIDEAAGTVLAVCTGAGRPPEWRTYELSAPIRPVQVPSGCTPAAGLALPLGQHGDPWQGWVPVDRYVHQPLVSAGRWLGGVLLPAPAAQDGCEALAAAMGLALGMAQQRSRASALSEELAGASQAVAAARDGVAEARALAVVEDLATGAAHELNNPLTVMSGRAQMMRDKARSRRQKEVWQSIVDQSQRISDLISELMAYAKPPSPAPEAVSARDLLASAAKSFAASDHPQAAACRVDIEAGDDVPAIWADREQMHGVMVELITNAATAATSTPHVRMSAEADDLGRAVILTVADDGPGMDEQTVQRVYTPFFSSQPAGRRPGLGLPKARRLVEKNGGRIWLDSEPGRGTTVSIRLPAVS